MLGWGLGGARGGGGAFGGWAPWGGGGAAKWLAPGLLVPNGGPAHGLHPRFVVAKIWADRLREGRMGGGVSGRVGWGVGGGGVQVGRVGVGGGVQVGRFGVCVGGGGGRLPLPPLALPLTIPSRWRP